jgi:hypothetical protein
VSGGRGPVGWYRQQYTSTRRDHRPVGRPQLRPQTDHTLAGQQSRTRHSEIPNHDQAANIPSGPRSLIQVIYQSSPQTTQLSAETNSNQ